MALRRQVLQGSNWKSTATRGTTATPQTKNPAEAGFVIARPKLTQPRPSMKLRACCLLGTARRLAGSVQFWLRELRLPAWLQPS